MLPVAFLLAAAASPNPDEIVVTGRGLEPPAGEEAFASVTLGRERLAGGASSRLEQRLRDVPGFQLFRRSDSRSANPTSQGPTFRGLGGNAAGRVLIVVDGVPQADPFGGWVSWPAFDPQRLGEARVTRGGGSGIWGSGALAGTIELSSALPSEIRGLTGRAAYGSRDGVDAHAGIGLPAGGGFFVASVAFERGDGFIPIVREQRGAADRPAAYEQMSVSGRALIPVSTGSELQASLLAFSDSRERGTAFSAVRTRGADASVRLVGRHWSALGYVQARDFYNRFAAVPAGRASASRTSEQYSVPSGAVGARIEARPTLGTVELRLGADARRSVGETREHFAYVGAAPTRIRIAGGRTTTAALFAEASAKAGALTLTGGARLDHWSIGGGRLEERVLATGVLLTNDRYPDRHGWRPTARGGLAWHVTNDLTARASAYLGWRLPTLNELYRPFRVGVDAVAANPALAPERLRGVEAGFDWRPAAGLRFGATAFDNRLAGAIANVTLGRGPGVFPGVGFVAAGGEYRQRRNLDAITSRGIELDASWRRGAVELSGGWSYAEAEVRASGAAAALDGLRPAQTPRHSLSSTLAWTPERGARASLTARYAGTQAEDDLNRLRLPGALTFDAAASLPISPRLALEARAENLTGERVIAAISADGTRERATPRTLWLGLRLGLR